MSLLAHIGTRRRVATGRREPRRAELVLGPEQQAALRAAGYGPDGPARDFADPAVRADFVAALRACGALGPPAPACAVGSPPARRVG